MNKYKAVKICMLVLLILLIVNCNSTKSKLLGKWSTQDHIKSIEFLADDTYIVSMKGWGGATLVFDYKVLSDGKIKINSAVSPDSKIVYIGEIVDGCLVINKIGGKEIYYKVK